MPIFGYKNDFAGTLRLWQAEPVNAFDFDAFNRQDYFEAARGQIEAENISGTLYPNDNARPGKLLRLKQEYFFSAASMGGQGVGSSAEQKAVSQVQHCLVEDSRTAVLLRTKQNITGKTSCED